MATRTGWKRIMLDVLITAAAIYAAVVVLMYFQQRNFMYYPALSTPPPELSGVAEMREISSVTADGLEIVSWFAPPSVEGKPLIVLFHGNAGSIGGRGFKARLFLDQGYGFMIAGYRGYSGNPGEPSEAGLMEDAHAALATLSGLGHEGQGLVLYGESLGTGVATAMAAELARQGRPVRALVLEAPFSSAVDTAGAHYPFLPVGLLLKDRFESINRIDHVQTSLFVVHGTEDWTIPVRLGRKLFAAASEPKRALWLEGAGHNDLYAHGAGVAILGFLEGLDRAR